MAITDPTIANMNAALNNYGIEGTSNRDEFKCSLLRGVYGSPPSLEVHFIDGTGGTWEKTIDVLDDVARTGLRIANGNAWE